MENSTKINDNKQDVKTKTVGRDVGNGSEIVPTPSPSPYADATDVHTDNMEFSGHMKYGLTEISAAGAMTEYEDTAKGDCETVYKPSDQLFNRLYSIQNGSINPGAYGFLVSRPFNETTLLLPEAARNATGYTGYRCNLVFTLVVAAPPQASGILKLAWWPLNEQDGLQAFDKTKIMPYYSQTFNAELNLAEASTVTLKVPYNFYASYLRIGNATPRMYGFLGLGTYTPIGGAYAASSIVSYTIYMSYENMELINPGSTIVAQSGFESKAIGPVTQIMSGVTRLAKANIGTPFIGAYAKTLAWVSGGIGAVAAHYGWSKPNDAGGTMMQPTTGRNHINVLGVCNAADFGMFANNAVKPLEDLSTSGVDEMSICHLTCIPSPIFRGKLTVSNLANTVVYSTVVSPNYFFYQTSDSSYTQVGPPATNVRKAIIPTPIFYLGEFFSYWRGDLVFRVKFARSKFSAGRVMLCYNPKPDSLEGELYSSSRINYNSVIVDLRTDSVVDLEVPFSYPMNLCSTFFSDRQNIGAFYIRVLDPIIVPTGVSPDLPFVVEVFSKCGLAFGGVEPGPMAHVPYTEDIYAQSGLDFLKETIGEAVLSVKQLMMRPTFDFLSEDDVVYTREAFQPVYATWDTQVTSYVPSGLNNLLSMISPAYRFYHGGLVLHAIGPTKDTTLSVRQVPNNSFLTGIGAPLLVEHSHNASVKVPFWSQHKKWPITQRENCPKGAFDTYGLQIKASPSANKFYFSFVAGDDFQVGAFTGFSPVVLSGNRFHPTF